MEPNGVGNPPSPSPSPTLTPEPQDPPTLSPNPLPNGPAFTNGYLESNDEEAGDIFHNGAFPGGVVTPMSPSPTFTPESQDAGEDLDENAAFVFCMMSGPCREAYTDWYNFRSLAIANGEDPLAHGLPLAQALKDCVLQHPESHSSYLERFSHWPPST